jgi:hypothetical protein
VRELEPTTPEKLDEFWEHVQRVAIEVRSWPDWKKAFACDLYSFPARSLADREEPLGRARPQPGSAGPSGSEDPGART